MDYHGAKEEHILRYLTIAQRDKRPEERQPLGTGIHAFVFCVASPFTYARYAQGLRLKYKRLYLPSNAQVIFNRALTAQSSLLPSAFATMLRRTSRAQKANSFFALRRTQITFKTSTKSSGFL